MNPADTPAVLPTYPVIAATNHLHQLDQRTRGRRHWCPAAFVFLVLLVLLVCRREVLTLPPFEDQALGYWTEASWLADHHFDLLGLARQRHYLDYSDPSRPGVRTYVYNLLPVGLAVLMRITPDARTTAVVWHVLALAAASLTSGLMYTQLRREIGECAAMLAALAVLTTPVVLAQADLAGMETFLLPAALASVPCLRQRHYSAAATVNTLALFVKSTVLIHVFAIVCLACGSWWFASDSTARRTAARELLVSLGLFLFSLLVFLAIGGSALTSAHIPWPRWFRLPWSLAIVPDLAALIGALGCLLLALAVKQFRGGAPLPGRMIRARWLLEILSTAGHQHPVLVHSTLVVVGMLVGMVGWLSLPRYFAVMVPPAYLAICLSVRACGWQRTLAPALALVVLVNLVNAKGRLYPDIARLASREFAQDPFLTPRSTAFCERSLEYLPILRQTVATLAQLDRQSTNSQPIFAPIPDWYLLAQPHLGYVSRPLRLVYVQDASHTYQAFERTWIQHVSQEAPPPVLLWTDLSRILLPAPAPGDEILAHDAEPSPLIAFIPRSAPHDSAALYEWYALRSDTGQWQRQAALARLAFHRQLGGYLRSANEILAALRQSLSESSSEPAGDAELAFALRELLHEIDAPQADCWLSNALAELRQQNRQRPCSSSTPLARWLVQLRLERRLTASDTSHPAPTGTPPEIGYVAPGLARLEPALAERWLPQNAFLAVAEPSAQHGVSPPPARALATALFELRCGADARARAELERLQDLDIEIPELCQGLGLIHFHLGNYESAAHWLERALEMAPEFTAVRIDLAALEARRGNRPRAEELLLDAHRRYPRDVAPSIQLEAAWMHDQ